MPSFPTRQTLACSCALLLLACGSDKTRVADVTNFSLRECKASGTTGELATGRETADYAGLDCVAWRVDGEHVDLDLVNRVEMCGFQGSSDQTLWTPALAQTADDALRLSVSWESWPNACGQCLHDFSVQAKGLALADTELHLSIETRSCKDDCSWSRDALDIPAAQSGEGIRCRYVDWNRVFGTSSYAGTLGGPAREGTCNADLVATEIDGATVCLKACDADDACSPPLTKCDSGVCKLTDAW